MKYIQDIKEMEDDKLTTFSLDEDGINKIDLPTGKCYKSFSFITFKKDDDWIYFDFIQTNLRFRGKGYARKLLSSIVECCINQGFRNFELFVNSNDSNISNIELVKFYKSVFINIDKCEFSIQEKNEESGEISLKFIML